MVRDHGPREPLVQSPFAQLGEQIAEAFRPTIEGVAKVVDALSAGPPMFPPVTVALSPEVPCAVCGCTGHSCAADCDCCPEHIWPDNEAASEKPLSIRRGGVQYPLEPELVAFFEEQRLAALPAEVERRAAEIAQQLTDAGHADGTIPADLHLAWSPVTGSPDLAALPTTAELVDEEPDPGLQMIAAVLDYYAQPTLPGIPTGPIILETSKHPVEEWRVWYCFECRHAGQPQDHLDCEATLVPGRLQLWVDQ